MFARQWSFVVAVVSVYSFPARGAQWEVASAAEVAAAAQAAAPGDEIVMRDGLWTDADILFDCHGTARHQVTLRAQTPGKVILSGQSRLRLAGEHLVVEGLWFKDGHLASGELISFRASSKKHAYRCRITNCAVTDCNPPDRKAETKWVSLYGTHNRFDHCELTGKENAGTTLVVWLSGEPNHHQIDHNYFGPRPALGANGGETIRVGTSDWSMSDSHTIVEHNLFRQCNGEIEVVSNKSCANIYRYNTFLDCEGALTLRHGNRCTVQGNFFHGHGKRHTGGVRIIGEDHRVYNNYFADLGGDGARSAISMMNGIHNSPLSGYFQVQRAIVAFNTFVHCRSNFALGISGSKSEVVPPKDCIVANNLILSDQGSLVKEFSAAMNLRWEANIVNGSALAAMPVAGVTVMDAELAQSADGLWRPSSTSAVRGAAAKGYSFVVDDIDGQARGAGADVGCDQVSSAPVLRRPMDLAAVGPNWSKTP